MQKTVTRGTVSNACASLIGRIFFMGVCLASVASAQLTVHVDTTAKEYYLSGSATGAVGGSEMMGYNISWDNDQPYNGGYTSMLSDEAFTVSGTTGNGFILFLHGNGNVNGGFDFSSGGTVTLTGNADVRFGYGSWDGALIAELESKAALGETVLGSAPAFNLAFSTASAAVPEPSTYAAILGGLTLAGVVFVRARKNRV
jgi:hypothetical protein